MTLRCVVWIGCSLLWALSSACACDCIGPSVATALERTDAVFRGKVVLKKEIHRKNGDQSRRRFEVHFRVSDRWKGLVQQEIVLHEPAGASDCDNVGFDFNKEYVVFARWRVVTADTTFKVDGRDFIWPDTWNDVLPIGTRTLVVQMCNGTQEHSMPGFQQTIAELGPPLARAAN